MRVILVLAIITLLAVSPSQIVRLFMNRWLIIVIFGLGFSACATNNTQLSHFVGAHIDAVIETEGGASEVYYDAVLGHVYVWESGIGDSPTCVSLYADGDGTVTGWSVSGEISLDKLSDLFKFLKRQSDDEPQDPR